MVNEWDGKTLTLDNDSGTILSTAISAGKKVKDIAYLRYELYQHNAGDRVEITYIRDGKEKKADVVLGSSE